MRNDIPFIETAYAAQALGAYSVPVNWHFKAEEIVYILGDCGARVLVGHADLIAPVAAALPKGVAVIIVATPPEVASAYGIAPVPPSAVPGARDYEAWLASHAPHRGDMPSPPLTMFYTSGTTGHPKGVRRPAPTPAQMGASSACAATCSASRPASAAPCQARSTTPRPTRSPCARDASPAPWC